MDTTHDCIIVGGGAAGLSAALALGRARRTTLLVDAGAQSNLLAHGIGGLLGHDRRPPAELYAAGRAELAEYPTVEIRDGAVATLTADGDGSPSFTATLRDGSTARARRVLLATGMEYRHLDLPGVAERWGGSVFHCPFCHGWEVRGRPLAVLSSGAIGVHQALLLRSWSDRVTLLADPEGLAEDERARLADADVALETRAAVGVRGAGTAVEAIDLEGGGELSCEGVLVFTTLHQRSTLAVDLGVALAEPTPMAHDAIQVDEMQATSLPGVYAAGDVLARPPSVAGATASGYMAGAAVVGSLFV